MTVTQTERFYRISFAFRPHLVEQVKQLPGKRWDPVNKVWLVPLAAEKEVMEFAQKNRFTIGSAVEQEQELQAPPMPKLSVSIPLKMRMFPYQEEGVAYNLEHRRVIVGDQPGLGKTAQAIATISAAQAFPCLVICRI